MSFMSSNFIMGNSREFTTLTEYLVKMESGVKGMLFPSGMSAIAMVLMAFAKSGAHILVSDGVYSGTRSFINHILKKNGIEVTYYNPMIGTEILELFQDNTTCIFCESPSAWSFEIQ